MKPERRCGTCAAFVARRRGEADGRCHRNPPQPVADSDGTASWEWPAVDAADHCWKWIGLSHASDAERRRLERQQ